MKYLILIVATVAWYGCYSQSAKKNIMDSSKKNNPVYSNTDTDKVALKDEEWKKILSPEVYQIARQKGTERPWSSKFETSKELGRIIAQFAVTLFLKAIPSLKVVAGGLASTNQLVKAP